MNPFYKAIGLMSGTSMDGIDVSLIETNGEIVYEVIKNGFYPYSDEDRSIISKTMKMASLLQTEEWHGQMALCTQLVTSRHITAVNSFIQSTLYQASEIDLIGFHGQTVFHQPENRSTIQLGDGQYLATKTGIDVVYDFRSADVKQGGQGAPLVPVFHQALALSAQRAYPDLEKPTAIINIGGVANISYIDLQKGDLIAFDTGPGNALMDDWMKLHSGKTMDEGGKIARSGTVHLACLERLMSAPYFTQAIPKSLDRDAFPLQTLQDFGLNLADGLATLSEFTAQSIVIASNHLPSSPENWIITGGGTKNDFLMDRLAALTNLVDGSVSKSENFGWNSDFMEAQAFGFLAVRHLLALPQTFPNTTGIDQPIGGGVLALS